MTSPAIRPIWDVLYATADDLAAYTQSDAPANAVVLLRGASRLIRSKIAGGYYLADDTTGLPTDAAVLAALNAATCAQAAAWAALGIDPLAGGVQTQSGVKAAQSLDGASVTYADGSTSSSARATAAVELVPDAVAILQSVNLLSMRLWTFG